MKYGMEGYGLYWHCLELIADAVDQSNITFELEHDAEIIAHDTGIHYERVQEMMTYMVDLGLFENSNGTITCLKLAKRIDQSMTSNPHMRQIIKQINENHDGVMTESTKGHDQIRLDKTRTDKKKQKTGRSTESSKTSCEKPPPENLDMDAWERYVEYRKEIRKPVKPASVQAAQRKLATFGKDQAAVVEQSIAYGYQGLFELKDGGKRNGARQQSSGKSSAEDFHESLKRYARGET